MSDVRPFHPNLPHHLRLPYPPVSRSSAGSSDGPSEDVSVDVSGEPSRSIFVSVKSSRWRPSRLCRGVCPATRRCDQPAGHRHHPGGFARKSWPPIGPDGTVDRGGGPSWREADRCPRRPFRKFTPSRESNSASLCRPGLAGARPCVSAVLRVDQSVSGSLGGSASVCAGGWRQCGIAGNLNDEAIQVQPPCG